MVFQQNRKPKNRKGENVFLIITKNIFKHLKVGNGFWLKPFTFRYNEGQNIKCV